MKKTFFSLAVIALVIALTAFNKIDTVLSKIGAPQLGIRLELSALVVSLIAAAFCVGYYVHSECIGKALRIKDLYRQKYTVTWARITNVGGIEALIYINSAPKEILFLQIRPEDRVYYGVEGGTEYSHRPNRHFQAGEIFTPVNFSIPVVQIETVMLEFERHSSQFEPATT